MEPTSQDNSINAIKDIRKLLNELGSNLSREQTELEKNSIKRKMTIIF